MLIVGRAIAGIGCGGLWVGAMVIIALSAPMHKRAMLTGILTGCAQMGLVLGPLIGGVRVMTLSRDEMLTYLTGAHPICNLWQW
jgi:MFS family permease